MYSTSQLFLKSTTNIATGATSDDGLNTDVIADEDNDVTVEREAIANHMIRPTTSSNTKVGCTIICIMCEVTKIEDAIDHDHPLPIVY